MRTSSPYVAGGRELVDSPVSVFVEGKPVGKANLLSEGKVLKHESTKQEGAMDRSRLSTPVCKDGTTSTEHPEEQPGCTPGAQLSGVREIRSCPEAQDFSAGVLPVSDERSGQTASRAGHRKESSQGKEVKEDNGTRAQEKKILRTRGGFSLRPGTPSFVAVYPAVPGVPPKVIRAGIEALLAEGRIADSVPEFLRSRRGLAGEKIW